jgi:hypothetical protein
VEKGTSLFEEISKNPVGAPRGPRGGRDAEWYITQADEYWLDHKRVPSEKEFLKYCCVARSTMKTYLEPAGHWPWEVFRDHAFPRV